MKRETFAEWMLAVDHTLDAICGMCSMDLPDWGYRDSYDSGDSPAKAAKAALVAAGW
jgi:hypothetical protein